MRIVFSFLFCLIVGSLSAETIGHVEYLLPNEAKEWKVSNELISDKKIKSTTLIYIPDNTNRENAHESFAVHFNDLTASTFDEIALARPIQLQFPEKQVDLNILDKDKDSVLYEWTVADKGQKIAHGWTRCFSRPKETVMLMYLTDQMNDVEKANSIWPETLKNAKWSN